MGMVDVLSHTLPTNLGYIAAYAMREGFDLEVWDYELEHFLAVKFLERVRDVQPAVIGFSCMTPTIVNGHHIATLVKRHFPHVITVVGGAHSSALPERTLEEFPFFDLVVNQEGEETFLEICRIVRDGDPVRGLVGTTWRDGKMIIREQSRPFIKDLDAIPFPARELYHMVGKQSGHSSRGFSNKLKSTEIFTSRGCPYNCTFCAITATFERTLRLRSPGNVFAEIEDVQKRFDIDHFVIADDTFGLEKGRLETLCEGFRSLGVKSWNCDTRVDCVTPESLRLMKESGCAKVAFGIETGSPRVVALNKKKIDLERAREAVHWAKEAGIKHIEGNFIIGSHPDETPKDLELTAKMIRELPLTFVSISVIVPYPGTPNYEIMMERGHIYSTDWSEYVMFGKAPGWRTEHFSPDDLLRYQKRLNRAFYLNPDYMLHMLLSIRSFSELGYYLKAGKAFIKWVGGGDVMSEGADKMDISDEGFYPAFVSR